VGREGYGWEYRELCVKSRLFYWDKVKCWNGREESGGFVCCSQIVLGGLDNVW